MKFAYKLILSTLAILALIFSLGASWMIMENHHHLIYQDIYHHRDQSTSYEDEIDTQAIYYLS